MNIIDTLLEQAKQKNNAGYPRQSIALCRQAIESSPNRWDTHCHLADYLLEIGDLISAEQSFQSASSLAPTQPFPRIGLAQIALRRGDLNAALSIAGPLVQPPNALTNALAIWGQICRRTHRSEDTIDVLTHALTERRTAPERALLHHTLAVNFRSLQRHREAFEQFTQANHLTGQTYNPESASEHTRRLTQIPTRNPLHATPLTVRPVLIVGFMRCGSTLLEQALGRHPQIGSCGEHEALAALAQQGPSQLGLSGHWAEATEQMSAAQAAHLAQWYVEEMKRKAQHPTATVLVDKNLFNYKLLEFARRLLPNVLVIHCVRDPLDTCWSCFSTHFTRNHGFTTRQEWLGHEYRLYTELMTHHKTRGTCSILEVSYEQFVTHTETELRRVLDALELDWDPRCLHPEDNRRIAHTASYAQVQRPVHTKSIGRSKPYAAMLSTLQALL